MRFSLSPFKTCLIAAVLSATITAGCLYRVHQRQSREAGRLRSKNNRMVYQAYLRQQPQTTPPAAPDTPAALQDIPGSKPITSPAPNSPPPENYRNEGQATPLATLQTFAWACDRGDADLIAKLFCFDSAARTKAETYLASLPETARAQWKSADEMAAAMLTFQGMARPFPNADILATATTEQIAPDRVMLRLPHTPRDRTQYQKTGDIWKYVITEAMIDSHLKQMAQIPANR